MRESPQPAPLADTPPEAEVEGRAARGRTVDKLFRDHNQDLLRFLQVKLQDEGEAREVAQEAYVRLLELENTKVVRFLRAYLFRIAANLAIDRLNARRRMRLESGTDHPELEQVRDPLDVERSFLAVEEFELFLTCLDELPPKCRQVFVMHRLRKLSTQEVATQLCISDRMVRKHIARALIYCRYRLDGLSASAALERIGDDKEEPRG